MTYAKTQREYRCPKCKKKIKRVLLSNALFEKWICPEHGEIKEALIKFKF